MITWQNKPISNKNGYVDFDDYMAEQARRRKLTRKKKNNKKPIINNSSNYDRTIKISRTLDRIEGLDVFGTLEKRDNVNDLNVLTVLRNLGSLPRFKGPSVSCTIWQCNFNG
jgi:hypothetical protein